jgi:hypothetical protein
MLWHVGDVIVHLYGRKNTWSPNREETGRRKIVLAHSTKIHEGVEV